MDDFEARRDGVEQLHRLAASVAEELAGLDLESTKLRVAAHPGVVVRFAEEGEPITADFRYGRITALVRDGVVVTAVPD